MGNLAPGPILNVALYTYYVGIFINVVASLMTLSLIWYMRRNGSLRLNLYLKCVLLLTFHQTIYDMALNFTYICGPATGKKTCHMLHTFGYTFGGIGAASYAFLLIAATTFMVQYARQPTQFEQNAMFVILEALILTWAVIQCIGGYNSYDHPTQYANLLVIYSYGRLVIIGMTAILLIFLYYRVRQVTSVADRGSSPLYHLVKKLVWYPIVQIVCRLGATVYNLTFKAAIDSFPNNAGGGQIVCLYMYVFFTPLAGLGGLLVFLYMQHGAWENLKRMLSCQCKVDSAKATDEIPPTTSPHSSIKRVISKKDESNTILENVEYDENTRRSELDDESGMDYMYTSPSSLQSMSTLKKHNSNRTLSTKSTVSSSDSVYGSLSSMDEGDLMRLYLSESQRARSTSTANRESASRGTTDNRPVSAKSVASRPDSGVISLGHLTHAGQPSSSTISQNPLHHIAQSRV